MHFKEDEVVAFYGDQGEAICKQCMTEEGLNAVKADEIITEKDVEEGWWFCDRCKEQLN